MEKIPRKLGEILVEGGIVTKHQLQKALDIQKMDALSKVPRTICRTANVLPIDMREGYLVVATATPEDIITEQNIKTITGMNVRLVIASSREIKKRVLP